MEAEVRSTIPDLPSTGDIARFARSPVALLDSLAKLEKDDLKPDPGVTAAEVGSDALQPDPAAPVVGPVPPRPRPSAPDGGFDPSLN